jgi:arylsulfatase A-like enzyme/Flp pilus assembly protein TadD
VDRSNRRRTRSKEPKSDPARRLRSLVLVILIGSTAAFGAWRVLRTAPPVEHSRLDVLLITVDTLRADALGAYGNRRAETPVIDRLAAAGARFDAAHAHNVTTLPSHANILSGRYPTGHGVRDNAGFRLPGSIETLATLLRSQGYRTGAFVSAFPLASRFGLNRGFDVYDDSFVDAQARPAFLEQERSGRDTVARATRWIAGGGHPYFAWVHVYEPHFPYRPPEPFKSQFAEAPYLGDVAAADAALAPLIDPIVAQGSTGHTLVVLTGDHGESLGEHGEATHGIFAYEATLRVPLIVFLPSRFAARVVDAPARHVDVLPTILDALSIRAPDRLSGRSLLPLLEGSASKSASQRSDSDEATYFEALSGALNRGWAPLYGLVRRGVKYIDLPIPELYDLDRDPGERHNLAESQPERVRELRGALSSFIAKNPRAERRVEDRDARDRLRSLGYITASGARPDATYGAADDPKRLIGLDAALQEVARLYLAGDLQQAVTRCRELVRERPTMIVSLIELAHLERESGNMTQAIEALRKAAAVNPDEPQAASLLIAYLTQSGHAREAAELSAKYVQRSDADVQVLVASALALAAAGRHADAVSALTNARAQEPGNAMLLVETGTVFAMAGDRERARREFEAALALNPNVARAHTSLAVLAAERGSTDEAVAHWKQAIDLDAKELDNLLAFCQHRARAGGPADARPYLELVLRAADPARNAREIEAARRLLGDSVR